MNVEVVVSINVHENVPFLMKQLNNIQTYLNCTYIVILNCNDYMKNALKVRLPPRSCSSHFPQQTKGNRNSDERYLPEYATCDTDCILQVLYGIVLT